MKSKTARPDKTVPRPYGSDPAPIKSDKRNRDHMGRVAELGCVLCELLGMDQETKTLVHHIREGQGMSQRSHDELTIPLCHEHHVGNSGVHVTKAALRIAKVEELDLLAMTIRKLIK